MGASLAAITGRGSRKSLYKTHTENRESFGWTGKPDSGEVSNSARRDSVFWVCPGVRPPPNNPTPAPPSTQSHMVLAAAHSFSRIKTLWERADLRQSMRLAGSPLV